MSWKELGAELNRAPQTATFQSHHVSPAKSLGFRGLYLDFQRMASKKAQKKTNMLFKFLYKDKDNILTEIFFWIQQYKSSALAHAETFSIPLDC